MPHLTRFTPAASLLLALAAAACTEADAPLAPRASGTGAVELVRFTCTARVSQPTVTCSGPAADGTRRLIFGGQNVNVRLTSSPPSYNAGTQIFQFDVTVQNLIPQPLATVDGSTPTLEGVRIFFQNPPVATSGSGTITVANEDGKGIFTAANQDYFQYSGTHLGGDGILSAGETSAPKTWQLNVPNTVGTFAFTVLVWSDVPFPNGWVDVMPAADSLFEGDSVALADSVRNALGRVVPGATSTWASSNPSVAVVSASGLVTAVSAGVDTVTATSGPRTGSAVIVVLPNP